MRQWWEGGIYENTYRKVDGKWRIHVLNYFRNGMPISRPAGPTPAAIYALPRHDLSEDPTGPDELIEDVLAVADPQGVPFHMKHPVTGEAIVAERWQGDSKRDEQLTGAQAGRSRGGVTG